MRPSTLAPLVALSLACASQPAGFTVTTRTQVELAGGAASPPRAVLTLSPPTLDRLDAATIAAALEGHGRWEESVAYGRVWVPFEALAGGFVPYLTRGEWVPARDGWYWQSGYAWGQIPFHYGRWAEVDGVWAWAPGTAFAPAWVEWRSGNAWVGWSPLAPLGADFAAPFAYCAGANLAGSGLQARAVTGPAAVSLYPVTSALGGSAWPPLPAVVAADVASLWAQPPALSPLAPVAVDLARRPPASAAPDGVDAIPCARTRATAHAAPVVPPDGGRSVGVIREGDGGATLVLAGALPRGTSGYSTVPARHEVAAPRLPRPSTFAARAPSSPAWDRAVAAPPPAVDPSLVPANVPGYGAWGGPRTLAAWASPAASPRPIRAMGGLGPSGFAAAPATPVAVPVAAPAGVISVGGGAPASVGQGAPAGPLTLR